MRHFPDLRRRILLFATAAACVPPVFAQGKDRALRLVVPFPPGGAVDAAARVIAEKLAKLNGRATIVENRPGAGGNIAAAAVANAAPDGATLLVTSNNHTINSSLYHKPGYAPEDFIPIAQIGTSAFVIVAHPSTNFKTLADLLNAARAKPKAISYGTGGNGHPAHLATELLISRSGISMQHIPYKGSGPLTSDLVGGQLPVGVISVTAAQSFVPTGQLVALAVTSKQRWPELPSVPTIAESGFPGYDYSAWIGVLGRKGMPESEIATLEREILAVAGTEDVRAHLHKQGLLVAPQKSSDFRAALAQDLVLNRDLVRRIGLQLD